MNFKVSKKLALAASIAAASTFAGAVHADWSLEQGPGNTNMETRIYTPSGSGDRSLMVVLHGCAQTAKQLQDHGNLQAAAEAHNAVMVVPNVDDVWNGYPDGKCWAFDAGTDTQGHAADVISITEDVLSRSNLNIDPTQVYITGLSSGGALSLMIGCTDPELFAGVDAVAGPTIGTNQLTSTSSPYIDPAPGGITGCNNLAGTNSTYFSDQIGHVTWGNMDLDGSNALYPYDMGGNHPGRFSLVSAKFSKANVDVMQDIYNSGALSSDVDVLTYGGLGSESNSKDTNGKVRVGQLILDDTGHAWPSGNGEVNGVGGDWIAQHGLHYADYILNWFDTHNLRKSQNDAPVVSIAEPLSVTTDSVTFGCSAEDNDGTVTTIESQLFQNGSPVAGSIANIDVNNCAGGYTDLDDDSNYTLRVTATDDLGAEGSDDAAFTIGNPGPQVTATGSADGDTLCAAGTATDNGTVASLAAELKQSGSLIDSQGNVALSGDDYSVCFDDVIEGDNYTIEVTATDNDGKIGSAETELLSASSTQTVTATLTEHIAAGRLDYTAYSTCYLSYGTSAFALTLGNDNRWSDGNGCIGPVQGPVDPGGNCVAETTFNYYHKTAGRAYSTGLASAPDYFANGSDDTMPGSTWGTTTLHSNDGGSTWYTSCP